MNCAFRLLRASIFVTITLFGAVSLAPERAQATGQAAVAAAGLGAVLVKALPTIVDVISKLFKPSTKQTATDEQNKKIQDMKTSSASGGTALELYVKRTQAVSTIVGATGDASTSLATMIDDIGGKTMLTEADLNDMRPEWKVVTGALDEISAAKPDPKAFEGDVTATLAIKNMTDKKLRDAIEEQLKYNPAKPDPKLVAKLQKNLVALQSRFTQMGQVASAELQFVSEGLAEISAMAQAQAKPQQQQTPGNIKKKAQDIKESAFTDGGLDLTNKSEAYIEKLKVVMVSPAPIA